MLDVVVAGLEQVADGVVALTLSSPDGTDLPAWEPGAHIDLHLGDGLIRQYSLCGDPSDRASWRVAVLLEPDGRGGSARVHALRSGDRLVAGEPRNHFPFLDGVDRYVFVAGGIGITPLLPMIAAAEAAGALWTLHYGGRTRASMAYVDDLTTRYGDKVVVLPQDEVGLIDLATVLARPARGALVYCCGPEPLLAAVEERTQDWPRGLVHMERFSAKEQEPSTSADFEVEFRASGRTAIVPAGVSILEVAQAAGIPVEFSCGDGICGTCETLVLEGVPEHRDSVLSPAEQESNEVMMICCSRSRSVRLVLDL
ncbi:PDR/VanB family oxidoreductase [Nocardia sp. CA-135398]|uniref:PDR/VanB family oxidoreductase n=1 Tax=Nocardia sp. CA-135398 TaxID=3239977 RepID=UPI003D969B58